VTAIAVDTSTERLRWEAAYRSVDLVRIVRSLEPMR